MNEFIKKFLAALCALFGYLWGDMDGLFKALVALIVLDYITGIAAAAVEHRLSSEIGAKGIAKKIFMLLVVAVANIIDVEVIGTGSTLRTVATVFYIANEGISLLENGARIGVPLPKKLIDVLAQLKDKGDNDNE